MPPTRARSGLYGGKTAEERRVERRARLLTAGTEIWVADGWAAVSMRAVCARAGLTDRYFYQEFHNVDDLLTTLWDGANERAIAAVVQEFVAHEGEPPRARLRSGIAVFVAHLATHPEDARMLYGDSAGCAVLTSRQRGLRLTGASLIAEFADPVLAADVDRADFLVLVRMAIGGFLELLAGWQAGDIPGTVEEIVAHATHFGDLLAASVAP